MSSDKTYTVKVKSTGQTIKVFEWEGKEQLEQFSNLDDHNDIYRKDDLEFISES